MYVSSYNYSFFCKSRRCGGRFCFRSGRRYSSCCIFSVALVAGNYGVTSNILEDVEVAVVVFTDFIVVAVCSACRFS